MKRVTKTINPLHFEDLEPHRFEDLIRQLIYDFRKWYSIEALGRSGSDEGMDVRAIERVVTEAAIEEIDEDEIEDESITNLSKRYPLKKDYGLFNVSVKKGLDRRRSET